MVVEFAGLLLGDKRVLGRSVAVVPKEEAEPLKVLQKQVKKLDAAAKMSEKKLCVPCTRVVLLCTTALR